MAVDLKSNSMFQRLSLLVEPDCLVKLEHERTKDRVRKVMYDRVEQVIVWRQIPWVRVVICGVLLVLPGLLMAALGFFEIAVLIIGILLLITGAGAIALYLYCGKTTIRIIRGGKNEDIVGVFRPGKVRTLLQRLITGIQTTQAAGFQRIAEAQAAAAAAAEQMPEPEPAEPTSEAPPAA